jgi:hypothetical protein
MKDDILFGPEHHHRLVAPRPVVGHGGGVLVALDQRRIHIEGRRLLPGPALDAGHQRAIGDAQAREGRGLQGNRRLGTRLPERPVLDVEGLQEVPDGGGRREGVPEQRREALVLPECGEVLTAVPAARPERDQALDELRRREPALALLDGDVRIDRLRDPELPEQFDHQRDAGAAGDQRRVNRIVDLEG